MPSAKNFWQYQAKVDPLEPVVPPAPDFDWFQQQPDVMRPSHQARPGLFAAPPAEHESVIPTFDWFAQEPDVVRPSHQTRLGLFGGSLEPLAPPAPDFDWFLQQTDVVRLPHRVRPGLYVSGVDALLFPSPPPVEEVLGGPAQFGPQIQVRPIKVVGY